MGSMLLAHGHAPGPSQASEPAEKAVHPPSLTCKNLVASDQETIRKMVLMMTTTTAKMGMKMSMLIPVRVLAESTRLEAQ